MARSVITSPLANLVSHAAVFPKTTLRRLVCARLALVLLLAWPSQSVSQLANPGLQGVQMFSTNEYGVDIATGNVNIDIPLRSKAGKIPFWSRFVGTSGLSQSNH